MNRRRPLRRAQWQRRARLPAKLRLPPPSRLLPPMLRLPLLLPLRTQALPRPKRGEPADMQICRTAQASKDTSCVA